MRASTGDIAKVMAFYFLWQFIFQVSSQEGPDCGQVVGGKFDNTSRIVGGEEVGRFKYPWAAVLILKRTDNPLVCGGTLISEKHVLTAAHCFNIYPDKPKKDHFRVGLGWHDRCAKMESTRQLFNVAEAVVHEKYDPAGKFYDIAMITLEKSTNYPPICLPPIRPCDGQERGWVIGFGVTQQGARDQPCKQMQVEVTKYTLKQCQRSRLPRDDSSEPSVFCAGSTGKDSCQGDSGGPFVTLGSNGRLIHTGIVSYGYGCAQAGLPGLYTNVCEYLDWIADHQEKT